MRLENSFEVPAGLEQSWRLLNDVPSVVPCLPGAELVEVVGENAWKAKLHVKLGPIALQFLADIVRERSDEAAGLVVLTTKARESKGRGSAEATIESTLKVVGYPRLSVGPVIAIVTKMRAPRVCACTWSPRVCWMWSCRCTRYRRAPGP